MNDSNRITESKELKILNDKLESLKENMEKMKDNIIDIQSKLIYQLTYQPLQLPCVNNPYYYQQHIPNEEKS